MPEWILASASPRRKEILTRLGLTFSIDPSNIQEPARKPEEPASRYVVRLARMKARETGKKYDSGLIIGADTVVVLDNRLLGKPVSRDEAKHMLVSLSGHWHEVVSGLCILDSLTGHSRSDFSISRVHFRPLSARDIEWYLETEEFHDKAGAYAIQGYASLFIDRIDGCYFNIVGFPVSIFDLLCRRSGIRLQSQLNINSSKVEDRKYKKPSKV